jgi:4-alpha-glucanotransferase
VISAPKRCYTGQPGVPPGWGVFLPLYALNSKKSWGAGDFSDLSSLATWTASMGGSLVATLPLLAAFLDEPFEPSPYSPASRLFWNEFYVDPRATPEFLESEARSLAASSEFQTEIESLRGQTEVSYKRVMAMKRRVLELQADRCLALEGRRSQFEQFAKERPELEDYALFRAVTDRRRETWHHWPAALRDGAITEADYDASDRLYHLYSQFLVHEQLSCLRDGADKAGVRLYFDLPLGSNSAGFDVWRERDAFATALSAGAPPDALFALGQDWGFPPPHPENTRLSGYRHWRAVLANMMRYGRALRIDHIMGLHRLYCISHGMGAREGVYVRYRADELYAVLSLESHRHKAIIVGEDLGTVPRYVRPTMGRHAVHRTYVVQYETSFDDPLPEPSRMSVATVNTHDMPPFAAFWSGLDVDDRLDLQLMTKEQAETERKSRAALRAVLVTKLKSHGLLKSSGASAGEILQAILVALGRSPARQVIVNLEDLWLETRSQNVPGTVEERVNWRRKAACTLEEIMQGEGVVSAVRLVDKARKRNVKVSR